MLAAIQKLSECAPRAEMIQRPAVADYPAGAHLPLRTIDDFELVWMLRGHARLVGGDAEVLLRPGHLLLLPPGVPHGFLWDHERPSQHGYVHFGPESFAADPPAWIRLQPMTGSDPLARLCAYLLWLSHLEGDDAERQIIQTLRFLLGLFLSGPLPTADAPPGLTPPLAVALDHLRDAWSQLPLRRVGVAELAAAGMVSRPYFSRLFRATFGLSPAPALELVRCSRAETLLSRTDLPVGAIAQQCGFADLSHFSHRFTAVLGTSPTRYRTTPIPDTSVLHHPGVRRLAHLLWHLPA